MSKKEIVTSNSNVPDYIRKGSARGTECVRTEDLIIPRLELVQDISPVWKKDKPQYIEGSAPGMMYNNVTRELYGSEVVVVPIHFKPEVIIWKDRDSGGGFRGVYPNMKEAMNALAQLDDADDCECVETSQHFCYLLQEGQKPMEIVISMAKSKRRPSRKWNSLIRLTEEDSFARMYRIKVISDSNDRGQEYYNFDILSGDGKGNTYVPAEIYKLAETLFEKIQQGSVDINRDFDQDTAPAEY